MWMSQLSVKDMCRHQALGSGPRECRCPLHAASSFPIAFLSGSALPALLCPPKLGTVHVLFLLT